jgi:hypothetical protein
MSTQSFAARAAALSALRALQSALAAPSAYTSALNAALTAVKASSDRHTQRRRQVRYIKRALQDVQVASPFAARSIEASISAISRYP